MGNLILILLALIAGGVLTALLLQVLIMWMVHNPTFPLGVLIGLVIAVFIYFKFRNRDSYYDDYVPPIHKAPTTTSPKKVATITPETIAKPETNNQGDSDLYTCLIDQMGYSPKESSKAIEYIKQNAPDKPVADKIRIAINHLSEEGIGK